MLNQPEFSDRPPPGPAPDPRLMPHRVWSLGPAVSRHNQECLTAERRNSLRERESWTHPGPGLGCLPALLRFVCWQVFAEYEINLSLSLASRELSTEFSKYSTGRTSNVIPKRFMELKTIIAINKSIIKSSQKELSMYWRNQRFNLKRNASIKRRNAVLNYDPTKLLTGEIVSCKINNSCFLSADLNFFHG